MYRSVTVLCVSVTLAIYCSLTNKPVKVGYRDVFTLDSTDHAVRLCNATH